MIFLTTELDKEFSSHPVLLLQKRIVAFILFTILLYNNLAQAQISHSSSLYKTIKMQDSLLFDVGFNTCNLSQFEEVVSNNFEFYHDQAGMALPGLKPILSMM